jgi:hypothetical protein
MPPAELFESVDLFTIRPPAMLARYFAGDKHGGVETLSWATDGSYDTLGAQEDSSR